MTHTLPRAVGYTALIARYGIEAVPHHCESYITSGGRRTLPASQAQQDIHPSRNDPGDGLGAQLEFALKHEGVNLEILQMVFERANPQELLDYVVSKPLGKYARRLWYLYEWLTGKKLNRPDLTDTGTYVNLLEESEYFTAKKQRISRQKINDNLLGNRDFCPVIRKIPRLKDFIAAELEKRFQAVLQQYPDDVLRRALDYLFTTETKSSFEIEHTLPDANRTTRFVNILKQAGTSVFLNKEALLRLQRETVDPRFANDDWRSDQNYVSRTISLTLEEVHYISPQPKDVPRMMEGLFASARRMQESHVHPVLIAAAIAFGFVFIHPFGDGNGRIHRFLIHHLLSQGKFTPPGGIFPISATMLRQRDKYDALLESFSKQLMPLISYKLDEQGIMVVQGETIAHYSSMDMTLMAEGLFEFIEETIKTELPNELQFLVHYDKAKQAIQEIVDIPDRLLDLFIRLCAQNHGTLSKNKRDTLFSKLTADEITQMEAAFRDAFV